VDDDQGILNLVAKMVSRLGYHATTTADAADALLCLADTRYDMVISDYAMPRMDGYQLADQIREKHFGTRIIIMTGHRDPDLIDRCSNTPALWTGCYSNPLPWIP
jgi:DNA-binding NtrC family response regulator